jgi:serine phosphatase RsbU (regulator of sigma subunit)/anti-sigma regulatory factor (Ser/Thr protein kinase)
VRTSELVADDEAYRAFLVSVARTVSAALSAAVAYQAERVRADAQAALAHRLEQLVSVAQLLGAAHTDDEVLEVLTHHGLDVLGATTGSLALLDDHDHRGQVRAFTARSGAPADLTVVPLDLPVPMVHVAREGHELLLPDRDATLALFPEADRLMERADASAVASLPLRVGDRRLGSCTLTWPEARSFTAQDVELLRALAVLLAQALDRVAARRAEQRSALAVQRMSETLQRSLLTSPPRPEGLQIAVRYSPASEQAQVGGDWYDAFSSPDGSTSLVIGDVTGHDRDAAAAMGQMRNLLRATAYAVPGSPATVLAALEATMIGLEADALATAVLAQVGTAASGRQRGERVLRWCNAGHLPPVLHLPDGTVRMLAGDDPDLLLGMGEVVWRADTEALLPTGATLLLYTDGLVERRGESLDEGVARLCATVEQLAPMPLEQMCDELLRALLTSPDGQAAAADDVAILALRVHPLPDPPLVPLRPGEQRVVLPAEPVSVAQARRMATGACVDLGRRDLVDAVALLVSEVVTNAIRHGLGDVRVAVLPIAGGLRVEVGDDEPHEPVPRSARLEDEGGRGLALVEALAEDWGTAPAAVGKVVWFEVGTAPA